MKLKWKIALPVLALLLLSTVITTLINYTTTKASVDLFVDNIIESNLDTLVSQVRRAEETENMVTEEMDKKNLALTRALAEIVRVNAIAGTLNLQDDQAFQRIADMLYVDEVHITDDEGVLIGGNIELYYGFDFKGGDQTIPFLRILSDPSYELAQEPQPNASYGYLFQYTGTARTDETGIVQVGIGAEMIQKIHNQLDIANTAADMRIGSTGRASILQNGIIVYSQKTSLIGQNVAREAWYREVSSGRGKALIEISGESMYAGYANIDNMTMLVLFPEAEYNEYLAPVSNVGLIGGGIAVLISLIILILVTFILKPVGVLTKASQSLSNGDFHFRPTRRSRDEVGQLSKNFEKMAETFRSYIEEINKNLAGIAEGDLHQEISREYVGQFASIKDSINTIGTMLNMTMNEVMSASVEVSHGASQVANSAQAMAQASTEQSASVGVLSGSIAEIAERTRINADKAEEAAKLADTIKSNAEKGSRQMDEMITAVKDISEASQSIGKIMKTIDDIAFQTNILALNAAVEAARAGQHGKGFAVVAEEVRSLATKSAEAAKETGDKIQNSMDKAMLGTRIAHETASSLSDIVSGINDSTRLISEIARSSEEQSIGIDQINTGIDMVAQVVDQNSAAAEESAAASAEMSKQSSMLRDLISQFKLYDGNTSDSLSLPSGRR